MTLLTLYQLDLNPGQPVVLRPPRRPLTRAWRGRALEPPWEATVAPPPVNPDFEDWNHRRLILHLWRRRSAAWILPPLDTGGLSVPPSPRPRAGLISIRRRTAITTPVLASPGSILTSGRRARPGLAQRRGRVVQPPSASLAPASTRRAQRPIILRRPGNPWSPSLPTRATPASARRAVPRLQRRTGRRFDPGWTPAQIAPPLYPLQAWRRRTPAQTRLPKSQRSWVPPVVVAAVQVFMAGILRVRDGIGILRGR